MLVADAAGVVTAADAELGAVLAIGAPVLRVAQNGPRDAVFSVPEGRVAGMRTLLGKPGALQIKGWGDQAAGGAQCIGGHGARGVGGRRSGDPHLFDQGRHRP